jgi:hypothetical protein
MESHRRGEGPESAVGETALELLVRVAKLMLEARQGFGDFVAQGKLAFVQAAVARAREAGDRKPSIARLVTETGLTGPEVKAMRDDPRARPPPVRRGRARAERVLRGWWEDSRFHDELGRPAILRKRGPLPSMVTLVKLYSEGSLRAEPIIRELLDAQAVEQLGDGRFRAVKKTCVNVQWDRESVRNLGTDVGRHFDAQFHNLKSPSEEPLFVRSAESVPLLERDAAVLLKRFVEGAEILLDDARGSFERRAAAAGSNEGKRNRVWLAIQAVTLDESSKGSGKGRRPKGVRKKRSPSRDRIGGKGSTPREVGAT